MANISTFTPPHYNAVSFSGGKDSTAMLLMLLERDVKIDLVVNITSTWEFPQIVEHVERVKKDTQNSVGKWIIANAPFDYYLIHHKTQPTAKHPEGRIGYGWAGPRCRWCTSIKTSLLDRIVKVELLQLGSVNAIPYTWFVGIAADEPKRIKEDPHIRYPLYEWGVTEKEALQYCYDNGYDFGGLYQHFDRVSCFCCPLQSMKDLWKLRHYYPELWEKLVEKDSQQTGTVTYRNKETFTELCNKLDNYKEIDND